MPKRSDTLDLSWSYRRSGKHSSGEPLPGLLLLFSGGEAWLRAIPLVGGAIVLGRDDAGGQPLDDARISRRHAQARFERGCWHLSDLNSRNGTFVDGQPLSAPLVTDRARVLRLGDSLFGLLSDVRPFQGAVIELRHQALIGPTLRQSWDEIERAAQSGDALHLTGESGSGKELAARHFHASGPRAGGPFIAVNCAAIPANLAERLLFGAKKGAFSGADANVDGYLQAAHGGTLFLDEIAELEPAVQSKLLRVLESREVLALGAATPRKVELSICSATHQDLRAQTSAGKFREDLFFRIARPSVALPPLRDRLEDIPWIIQRELGEQAAHVSLVEACLLRRWPGNVRELMVELRHAAAEAKKGPRGRVESRHLSPQAGADLEAGAPPPTASTPEPSAEQITETLRREGGNVTRAARALGWHRNQLRRWLAKHDPSAADNSDE